MTQANHTNPWGEHIEYRSFMCRLIEDLHQSCILLCSQEPIKEISYLETRAWAAKSFKVKGLGKDAFKLLRQKGLKQEETWNQLIADYNGNPHALLKVASQIHNYFAGDIAGFLELNTTCVEEGLNQTLTAQFERLSALEQQILMKLANLQPKSLTFAEICRMFGNQSVTQLMTAVDRLEARSLVIKSKEQPFQLNISKVVEKVVLMHTARNRGDVSTALSA